MRNRQRGITLLEVLVSLGIMASVFAGVGDSSDGARKVCFLPAQSADLAPRSTTGFFTTIGMNSHAVPSAN